MSGYGQNTGNIDANFRRLAYAMEIVQKETWIRAFDTCWSALGGV